MDGRACGFFTSRTAASSAAPQTGASSSTASPALPRGHESREVGLGLGDGAPDGYDEDVVSALDVVDVVSGASHQHAAHDRARVWVAFPRTGCGPDRLERR